MNPVTNGLVTLLNGAETTLAALASPVVLAVVVIAVSLFWLGLLELEEVNRQGAKPEVGRH